MFLLFFICYTIDFAPLKNGVRLNETYNAKIYEKSGTWYYIKFESMDQFENCLKTMNLKLSNFMPIGDLYYSVFLLPSDAALIQKHLKIWLTKIPAKDKYSLDQLQQNIMKNEQYIVMHSANCQLPGKVNMQSAHLSYVTFNQHVNGSHLLSHTKCVRAFEPVVATPKFNARFNKYLTYARYFDVFNPLNPKTDDEFKIKQAYTGKNQCVLMADSGVDPSSPWLYDPDSPIIKGENVNHRKIKHYYSYSNDYKDDEDGHGTFLAGLMVGESQCSKEMRKYNGVAPNGKVVVADIGRDREIFLPKNLSDLSKKAAEQGCTAQLNAWTVGDQPLLSLAIDQIAYDNPNVLTIFPAEGDEDGFIQSPSDAKNVLTVGGVFGKMTAKALHDKNAGVYVYPTGMPRAIAGICDEHGRALFNTSNTNFQKLVIDEERSQACVMNDENEEGLDNCRVLLYFESKPLTKQFNVPVIRMPPRWKQPFKTDLELSIVPADIDSGRRDERFEIIPESGTRTKFPGRIKPEIVAPAGPIASSKSFADHNECSTASLTGKTGTSVAAAFIAADVMLLSQFFQERYKIKLSATLAKALLIASSSDPLSQYKASEGNTVMQTRDHKSRIGSPGYGFGMPAIERCIKNLGYFQKNIKIKPHQTYVSCFTLKDTGQIDITISWLDMPRDPYSTVQLSSPLVAYVTENRYQETTNILGNNNPNEGEHIDTFNTNIKISFYGYYGRSYQLVIIADDFDGVPNAEFSYVVLGDVQFDGNNCEFNKKELCPRKCHDSGTCNKYKCTCYGEKSGDFCQYTITTAFFDKPTIISNPKSHEWYYYSLSLPLSWGRGSKIVFDMSGFDDKNYDFLIQAQEVPSHQRYFCTYDTCQWGIVDREKHTLTLPYESWDFMKGRDPLFIGVFCKSSFARKCSFIPTVYSPNDEI